MKKITGAGVDRPTLLGARPGGASNLGPSDFGMQMALRQIAFDPSKPVAPPRPASAFPMPQPATSTPSDDLALRRREWLLDVAERQRSLSAVAGGLPRVRDLPHQGFLDHFYAPGRPVVIEGAIDAWPALARWTPDYLRRAVGSAPVEYQNGRDSRPDYELLKDRHKETVGFDRFIERITVDGAGNDAYITAYNSATNGAAFAPLMEDVRPIDAYLTPANGMLWIGPADTFTPLHFDLTNNLLVQVTGRKRVLLVPPSETRHLAHRRHVFSEVHDIAAPDRLAQYPAARLARRFEVDLGPGELLYIPVGWWHQVLAMSFSVTLTYTNFLWPNDAHESFPGG
ncbi:hypothetical protein BH10PSE12_BH10PSE12_14850 [soil metagenome]